MVTIAGALSFTVCNPPSTSRVTSMLSPSIASFDANVPCGHPVSAAIGLEVLRLYEEGGLLANSQKVGTHFGTRLAALRDHPLVGDVRSLGLLAGVELVTNKTTKARPDKELAVPDHLARIGYKNRLIFRAFGDSIIGFAPPICISEDEVDLLVDRFAQSLDELLTIKEIRDAVD